MKPLLLKNIKNCYGTQKDSAGPISILIEGGKIKESGSIVQMERLIQKEQKSAQIIDCSNFIAIPGIIDSHTHLLFHGTREKELYFRAQGLSYLEILNQGGGIYNTVRAVRDASEEVLVQNGLRYLDMSLRYGITTIEIKSGYGLDFDSERKMLKVLCTLKKMHPVDIIPTFLVHAVPKECDRSRFLEDVSQRWIPEFREYSDWFDLFLEKGVFDCHEAEKLLRSASDSGYSLGLHVNQVNDIGGIPLAVSMGVRHVDHLEVLSDEDAIRIQNNPNLFAVFLPTAETFVFSRHLGQIQKLHNIPSRTILSSDFNPGSSPVLSPYLVMTGAVLRYRLSDCNWILQSYTKNPAVLFNLEDRGILMPGKKADLVLLNLENLEQVPYFGTLNFVAHVIKNGKIVYSLNES